MRTGALSARVRIERPVETTDGMGGATVTWTVVAHAWANIAPGAGREFWSIQHAQPTASHLITLRYRTDVIAGMRVVAGTAAYRVIAPPMDVEHRHEYLQLTCEHYADGAP